MHTYVSVSVNVHSRAWEWVIILLCQKRHKWHRNQHCHISVFLNNYILYIHLIIRRERMHPFFSAFTVRICQVFPHLSSCLHWHYSLLFSLSIITGRRPRPPCFHLRPSNLEVFLEWEYFRFLCSWDSLSTSLFYCQKSFSVVYDILHFLYGFSRHYSLQPALQLILNAIIFHIRILWAPAGLYTNCVEVLVLDLRCLSLNTARAVNSSFPRVFLRMWM